MDVCYLIFYVYLHIDNNYSHQYIYILHSIALPVPIFTITREGAPVIGESFSIICNATIKDTLSPNINLTWIYNNSMNNNIIITSNPDGSLTLNINPVQELHEGLYTCVTTVAIPDVPQQIVANVTYAFLPLGQFEFSGLIKRNC